MGVRAALLGCAALADHSPLLLLGWRAVRPQAFPGEDGEVEWMGGGAVVEAGKLVAGEAGRMVGEEAGGCGQGRGGGRGNGAGQGRGDPEPA